MKTLELIRMEELNGGVDCVNAYLSTGIAITAIAASAFTLNPVGLFFSTLGFIGGLGNLQECE
ncbi:hypothetical protein [Pontimicrobium sp. MEBiC06410]|jgi:hypothetical protein